MDGTEEDEIYRDGESDSSEEDSNVENEEDILLILIMTKTSLPSMMHKYHKFVTGT